MNFYPGGCPQFWILRRGQFLVKFIINMLTSWNKQILADFSSEGLLSIFDLLRQAIFGKIYHKYVVCSLLIVPPKNHVFGSYTFFSYKYLFWIVI